MSKFTTISGTETLEASEHCTLCRFWVSHKYYNLQLAGHRMVDEQKILSDVQAKREHDIPSEAHYHYKEAPCNERCIK